MWPTTTTIRTRPACSDCCRLRRVPTAFLRSAGRAERADGERAAPPTDEGVAAGMQAIVHRCGRV